MKTPVLPALVAVATIACALTLGLDRPTLAAMSMKPSAMPPKPSAREAAFISSVASDLQRRYASAATATAGGYYRTTRLEPDGTIIYFNNSWQPTVARPNFLWYDKRGRLVGLDYQFLVRTYPTPPGAAVFPVALSRWTTIDPHVHFGYKKPDGTIVRRGARMLPGMTDDKLTAAELRAAKLLPANATLLWTYVHPKSWDLGFWLVPNPNGAFADLNPNVKP